ncbi:DUF559 domain-containing protein [Pseudonocardia phyllosphaerae]|uniref:DUF559 domain-containing protein n=1 Tax=Pseudonocardia phyllosphaerae TaxID=3390502 RepID=UPI0039797CFA
MGRDAELDAVLRAQDGIATVAQAVSCGFSVRTVRRRIAEGRWRSPHPGVLLGGGHRYGTAARCRGTWLWAGHEAVLSGAAAAWWHRMLDVPPMTVDVTVPRPVTRGARPGTRVRRRDLAPVDRAFVRGVGVTARPLTALEAAAALDDGAAFLDRALQRWVTFDAVYEAWCRMAGARGAPAVRALLVAAGDRAASTAERRLVRLLRDARISGWVLGHPFGAFTLDLAFPAERVAIEFDGWAWHSDVERFRRDRRKSNELVTAGWIVLRVTWHELQTAPARVVAQVRHALERRRLPR